MAKSQDHHGGIPTERQDPRVFIIHAGEDKGTFVRPLVGNLQQQGLAERDIFFDDVSIRPGDVIRERIMSTLSSESLELAVIVVSTSFLNKSYWPRLEYETCLKNNKHLFPIWVDANDDDFKAFSESVGKYSPTLKQMSARRVQRDKVTNELPSIAAEVLQRLYTLRQSEAQPKAIQTLLQLVPSSSSNDFSDLDISEETCIEETVCSAGSSNEQVTENILKHSKEKQLELIKKVGENQLQLLEKAKNLLSRETISKKAEDVLGDVYQQSLRIIGVQMGCAIVHLVPENRSTLDSFWTDYKSGKLSSYFTDCLVTDEMREAAGQDLAVRVVMLDKQRRQWAEYFNTRDMAQMARMPPSLKMKTEVETMQYFLQSYQTGQIVKDFPDARLGEMKNTVVRVGLFGLTGSGKSSFVNTVVKCVEGKDEELAIVQSSGAEGTVVLEEFALGGGGPDKKPGFKLLDTRGFDVLGDDAHKEMLAILNGDIRSGQVIHRGESKETSMTGEDYKLSREIHVVLWFVKGTDPRLESGTYQSHMNFLKMQLIKRAMKTLTIITHDDELQRKRCTDQQRHNIAEEARQITGSDQDDTFFLTNYMKGKPFPSGQGQQVLDIVKTALTAAEYTIRMRQSKRKLKTM